MAGSGGECHEAMAWTEHMILDRRHPKMLAWVKAFLSRHPALRQFLDTPVIWVEDPPRSHHPEASYTSKGILVYPKFWELTPEARDYVFAHEIGHHVLNQWGYRALQDAAAAGGIDPWDTPKLPYGQHNFDEAFSDVFAEYHLNPTDLNRRYPAWAEIVRAVRVASHEALQFGDIVDKFEAGRGRVATKTHGEREDEEAERLIRQQPKKKPPRKDLHRRRMDTDPEEPQDKDLSMNYKDIGASLRVAYRYLLAKTKQQKLQQKRRVNEQRKQDTKHKPGDVWNTGRGKWRGMNSEGVPQSFESKNEAEAYARPSQDEEVEETTDTKPETKPEPDTKPETEPDPDTDTKPETEPEPDTDTLLKALPKAERKEVESDLKWMDTEERKEFLDAYNRAEEELKRDASLMAKPENLKEAIKLLDREGDSPGDQGEVFALKRHIQNVTLNPKMHVRSLSGDTRALDNPDAHNDRRLEVAEEAYAFYSGVKDEKVLATLAERLVSELAGLRETAPKAIEIRAMYHGLALSAAVQGVEIPTVRKGKTKLSVPDSQPLKALAKLLSQTGNEKRLLRTADDLSTPETRTVLRDSMGLLSDGELLEFIKEDSPLSTLYEAMENQQTTEDRLAIRSMIEDMVVDGISLVEPMTKYHLNAVKTKDMAAAKAKAKAGLDKQREKAVSRASGKLKSLKKKTTSALALIKHMLRYENAIYSEDFLNAEFPVDNKPSVQKAKMDAIRKDKSLDVLDQRIVTRQV